MKKVFLLPAILLAAAFSAFHGESASAQLYSSYPAGQAVVAPTPIYANQGAYYGMGTSGNCANGMCGGVTYGSGGYGDCGGCGGCGGCEMPLYSMFHQIWNGTNYWDGPGCSERVLDEWRKSWVACPKCNVFGENLNAGPNSLGVGYRSQVILENANPRPTGMIQKNLPSGYYGQGYYNQGVPANGGYYPQNAMPSYPTHTSPGGCSSCGKGMTVTANVPQARPQTRPQAGTVIPVQYTQVPAQVYQQAPVNTPQNVMVYPVAPAYQVVPAGYQAPYQAPPQGTYQQIPVQNNVAPVRVMPQQTPPAGKTYMTPVGASPGQTIYRTSHYPPSPAGWENGNATKTAPQAVPAVMGSGVQTTFTSGNFFQGGQGGNQPEQVPGYIRAQQEAMRVQPAEVSPIPNKNSAYKNREVPVSQNVQNIPNGWIPAAETAQVMIYPISQSNSQDNRSVLVASAQDGTLMETLPTPSPRPITVQQEKFTVPAPGNEIVYPQQVSPPQMAMAGETPYGIPYDTSSCAPPCGGACPGGCAFGCRTFREPCLFPGLVKALGCLFSRKPMCNPMIPVGNARLNTMPSYARTVSGASDMQNYYVADSCNRGLFTSAVDGAPFNGFFAMRHGCLGGCTGGCMGGCSGGCMAGGMAVSDTVYDEYGGWEGPADFPEAGYASYSGQAGTPGNLKNAYGNTYVGSSVSLPPAALQRTDTLLSLATQKIVMEDGTEIILEHDQTKNARLAAENGSSGNAAGINPVSLSGQNMPAAQEMPIPQNTWQNTQNTEDYPIIAVIPPQIHLAPGEILVSQQDIPLFAPQNAAQNAPQPEAEEVFSHENTESEIPQPARKMNVTSVSFTTVKNTSEIHRAEPAVWITVQETETPKKPLLPLKPAAR